MRKPFMGAPILTLGFRSNGGLEHPAIVTRVWSDDRVNVTIFGDNAQKPESYTSIRFLQTREEAVRARELGGPFDIVAFWNDAEQDTAVVFPTPGFPTDPIPQPALPPTDVLRVELAPSKFTMTPQETPTVDIVALAKRAADLAAEEAVA